MASLSRIALGSLSALVIVTSATGQGVDLASLNWQTPSAAVSISGNTIRIGSTAVTESESQASAYHIAAALLPPAAAYSITFEYDLLTWDSYNAPGTPNPPFNGGTGYWDSFSISIAGQPLWQTSLTDPITKTKLPGLGYLWGGSSFGDRSSETVKGKKTIVVPGNATGLNYLNVGLDTASLPNADTAFPSAGTFRIVSIIPTCQSIALIVPLHKQCNASWTSDTYDHQTTTMCNEGCATSSAAMILSSYGTATTPKELNDWLKEQYDDVNGNGVYDSGEPSYGYTGQGALIWDAIASYSSNTITYKGTSTGFAALDAELCAGRPTILRVPGHFVVATGKTSDSYTINDPGYSRTTLADYSGTFQSTRNFGPPGSGSLVIYAPPHARLLVTDPLGRRIGLQNSSLIDDIPGASYDQEQISGLQTGVTRLSQTVLRIPDPPQGIYSIEVHSDIAGPVKLEIYRFTRDERPQTLLSIGLDVIPGIPARATAPYSTKPGDLNGDGYVDERDLMIVEAALGSAQGRPRYNPVADVDMNRKIDVEDFKKVAINIPGLDRDGDGVPDGSDNCVNSDLRPTIVIGACDTAVPNKPQGDGCTLADAVRKCQFDIRNHGEMVSCTTRLTNSWVAASVITGGQKGAIQACAARTK